MLYSNPMKAISFSILAILALCLTGCPINPAGPYTVTGTSNTVTTVGTITQYRAVYATSFGSPGIVNGTFYSLSGVLVRPDASAIYTVENPTSLPATNRIQRWTPSGGTFIFGTASGPLNVTGARMRFINFDPTLNFVFGVETTPRLIFFNATTLVTNSFVTMVAGVSIGEYGTGTGAPAQNTGPGGVCYDLAGNWWLADLGNNRLEVFNNTNGPGAVQYEVLTAPFGAFTTFNVPFSVRLDFNGNIAVVDSGNNRIAIVSTAGAPVNSWGGGSGVGAAGLFNRPMDIATNTLRQYFVTDFYNNRVQRFDSSGAFLESFGSVGTGAGQFNGPVGISIDSFNTIYVVDQGNSRVQIWSNVTTTTAYTNNQTIWQ